MRTESVDRALLYTLWAGIFLLLFMPFIVSTGTIYPYIVGKAIYTRVVISLLFGLWLVLAYISPQYRLPRSWVLVLFAIYIGVSLLAGIFGVSIERSLWSTYERMQGIVDVTYWLALTIVVASVVRTMSSWRVLFNVNLGISLLVALMGIAQSQDMVIPGYEYLRTDERLGVTMGNPSFVAAFMMINSLIALGFLAQSFKTDDGLQEQELSQAQRRRMRRQSVESEFDWSLALWRTFWVTVVILDIWVITLTGTRGALIGLVAGLGAFAVFYVAFGNQRALKLAASGIAGTIILLVLVLIVMRDTSIVTSISSSNVLVRRMTDFSLDSDTVQSRLLTFSVGAESFANRPLLGWGPENYIVAFGRYYKEGTTTFEILDHAHNKPVEELVTRGLLGLVSYLAIWVAMFAVIRRKLKDRGRQDESLLLAVGAALVAYFVQNLFLFDTMATMLQLILLVAFVVSLDVSAAGDSDGPGGDSRGEMSAGPLTSVRRLIAPGLSSFQERPAYLSSSYLFATSRLPGLFVVVAALVLVALSVYLHWGAWHGATSILKVTGQRSTVGGVIDIIDESISSFQPLSNMSRSILFANVPAVWPSLSVDDRALLRVYVDEQAEQALAMEPENWRLNLQIGDAYREMNEYEPSLENVHIAQSYALEAARLAPERRDVKFLVNRLAVIEESLKSRTK